MSFKIEVEEIIAGRDYRVSFERYKSGVRQATATVGYEPGLEMATHRAKEIARVLGGNPEIKFLSRQESEERNARRRAEYHKTLKEVFIPASEKLLADVSLAPERRAFFEVRLAEQRSELAKLAPNALGDLV